MLIVFDGPTPGTLEVAGAEVGALLGIVVTFCFASIFFFVTVSTASTSLLSCGNCSVGCSFNLPSNAALQFANARINLSVGVNVGLHLSG
jgi:hypothetical protein